MDTLHKGDNDDDGGGDDDNHHHHLANMDLGHLLTRSCLTNRSLFSGHLCFFLPVHRLKIANPTTGLTLFCVRNPFYLQSILRIVMMMMIMIIIIIIIIINFSVNSYT